MSNIKDIVFLGVGFLQSLRLLKKQGIDVVFCKGGYVALPVCVAAWCRRIPVVLHESDTHPGLTNRIVARRAHTRCVGFTGVFADELHVGQLLSEQLLEYEHIAASEQTQILIMGGSQ
jgi:UDP-N-acetylglucosamine:LPS N-acetylglucosamine transferase